LIKNKMAEGIISAIVIEMMGRPADHLKQVMKDLLKKLDSEKGVKIIKKKIHPAKVIEQKDKEGNIIQIPEGQELYSTFVDAEVQTDSMLELVNIVFTYMPSHVEILEPSEFGVQNFDFTLILNDITKKMHQYDANRVNY